MYIYTYNFLILSQIALELTFSTCLPVFEVDVLQEINVTLPCTAVELAGNICHKIVTSCV